VAGGRFVLMPARVRGNEKAVLAMTSDVNFDVDTGGYLTITTTYTLEIPLTFSRLQPNQLIDCADDYLHNAVHPMIEGFERKTSRRLSADRRKLTVTVMDIELPKPLPDGCTLAKVKHSVSAQGAAGGINGRNHVISGTINLSPHLDQATRIFAWSRMAAIIRKRLDVIKPRPGAAAQVQQALAQQALQIAKQFLATANSIGIPDAFRLANEIAARLNPHGIIIMAGFSVDEDVLGRDISFSLQFKQVGAPVWSFFGTSGIFADVGTNFATWKRSMDHVKSPQSPRGWRGMRLVKQNDVVIDIGYSIENSLVSSDVNPALVNSASGPQVFGA